MQFVILEGFFKELVPQKINIYEHNYQNFNEREFNETLSNMNWDQIILINESDPNTSMNNLHHTTQHNTNYLLDELAPYKKNSQKKNTNLDSNPG